MRNSLEQASRLQTPQLVGPTNQGQPALRSAPGTLPQGRRAGKNHKGF